MSEEKQPSHAAWVAATRAEIRRLDDAIETIMAEAESKIMPMKDLIKVLTEAIKDEPRPGRPAGSKNPPKETVNLCPNCQLQGAPGCTGGEQREEDRVVVCAANQPK